MLPWRPQLPVNVSRGVLPRSHLPAATIGLPPMPPHTFLVRAGRERKSQQPQVLPENRVEVLFRWIGRARAPRRVTAQPGRLARVRRLTPPVDLGVMLSPTGRPARGAAGGFPDRGPPPAPGPPDGLA